MGGAPPSHSADQTRKLIAFSFLAISAVVAFDTRKLIATHPFLQERVLNLPWMAAACAVICVLRLLVSNAFRSLGEVLIRPRYTGSEREEKKDKFGTVCFKCLYMVVASYGGWRVLATRSWLPPVMRLGAGSYSNSVEGVYDGYPRDYEEMDFPVHAYYMVAGGYAVHSLVFHVFHTKRRNDFWEMVIHHFAAILLIVFSYVGDLTRVGTLVLIVHDVPDVVGYLIKAIVDTKYTALLLTTWVGLVVSWAVMRLYIYPVYIVSHSLHGLEVLWDVEGARYLACFMVLLLCTLQVLHVWWWCMFLWMMYSFTQTKVAIDMQARTDDKDTMAMQDSQADKAVKVE